MHKNIAPKHRLHGGFPFNSSSKKKVLVDSVQAVERVKIELT